MKKLTNEHINLTINQKGICMDKNRIIMFASDEKPKKRKQHKLNSCQTICSWFKARRDAFALAIQMEYIKQKYQKKFIFLTLIANHVLADELENEVELHSKACEKLMEQKEVKKKIKGYVSKLEVIYNKDRDDYQPRIHVLFVVNKSYFTDKNYYITYDRWLELWKQGVDSSHNKQVDVLKVREDSDKKMSELTISSVKDDHLVNEQVFEAFYQALKGKRLIVQTGLFKESMNLWKNGKLDKYKERDSTEYVNVLLYNWGKRNN